MQDFNASLFTVLVDISLGGLGGLPLSQFIMITLTQWKPFPTGYLSHVNCLLHQNREQNTKLCNLSNLHLFSPAATNFLSEKMCGFSNFM